MLYLVDKPVVLLRGKTGLVIFNALTGGAQYQRSGLFFL
jgi:hypothetical protein